MSTYSFWMCPPISPAWAVRLTSATVQRLPTRGLSLQWAAIKHDGDRRRWRGMHSLHADKSGTITVNLLKTSPTNAKLSVMYNAQSLSSATGATTSS